MSSQEKPGSSRSALLPIFLIVLVDVLGFTIVIPLLPFYAERFGASPLVATTLVSVYAVCSLISTPIIGKLSDQYGRKPLLMYSQAGTCAGFIVLAFSTSLWMVFIGRILPGLSAGNLSIAQAYISDHTAPENRAKAFGIIGIAFGIGFMFGPALGGWLGTYSLHLPFIVAAGFSAVAMFFTYTLLPKETQPPPQHAEVGPGGRRPSAFDWRTYAEFFGRPELRALYVQFFLFSFAFSCFFSGFALFAEHNDELRWGPDEVGYLFTFAGFLGILMQGGLLGRLVKRYGEFKMTVASFAASVVAYSLIGISTALWMLMVATTINAFGHGILRPVLTARLTQAVGRHEQGVVLGISGSLGSVAMAMAPPTGGVMLNGGYLVAWAMIPAVVSAIGLIATLAWSGVTERSRDHAA
ncbi:MAG: MFS transporter [Deltaproteobacteria bacterium]|nr:MFS transporter [Deltaproteobacteria bacterium]MDQ3297193.1 MFS transporter [Myxococcota bacterium]